MSHDICKDINLGLCVLKARALSILSVRMSSGPIGKGLLSRPYSAVILTGKSVFVSYGYHRRRRCRL